MPQFTFTLIKHYFGIHCTAVLKDRIKIFDCAQLITIEFASINHMINAKITQVMVINDEIT